MPEHDKKLQVLKNIKERLDGNVLISTKEQYNKKFSVDDIQKIGLSTNIIETKEGGRINTINVCSITEIKEITTGEILYPEKKISN